LEFLGGVLLGGVFMGAAFVVAGFAVAAIVVFVSVLSAAAVLGAAVAGTADSSADTAGSLLFFFLIKGNPMVYGCSRRISYYNYLQGWSR
jgi:hypothetical protein